MSAHPATKRVAPPSTRAGVRPAMSGRAFVLAGVSVATFGTAITMLPGGYNPFGPAKAFVLLCALTAVGIGFALSPELAVSAARRGVRAHGVWAAGALLGVAALATAMSIAPEQSLVGHYPEYQGLLLLVGAGIVGFGAFSLAGDDAMWEIVRRAATLAVLAVFAYALLQFLGADPVAYQREFLVRRVRSTLGNASNLGVFICLALPFVLAHARAERGAWRWLAWTATCAGAITLVWSLSRGAWAGALAGALVWLAAEGRSWSRATRARVAAIVACVAIVATIALLLLVPSAGSRLGSLADPPTGTAGWRVEVWAASTQLVAARPVLGFGPAAFRYAFPPRRTASMMAGETGVQALDDPHNLLASAAVSAGVAGLAALVWLLAEGIAAAWSLGAEAKRRQGGSALQFHFVTLDSAPLLALVLGLAIGTHATESKRARPSDTGGTADVPGSTALRVTRVSAVVLAMLLAIGGVLAGTLVLADRDLAGGFAAVADKAPWQQARSEFSAAKALANWEPAIGWALGRGAAQWISATGQLDSFDDGRAAMAETEARLPLDPLATAQYADLYLVYGLSAKDPESLQRAASLAEQAIAQDPENGYRWEAKGTALAALGDTSSAIDALKRAVTYAPADVQAWRNLAQLYARVGQTARQRDAQHRADALSAASSQVTQ